LNSFKYFDGSILTSDGKCSSEIRARVAMAKNTFNKRKELLTKSLNTFNKRKELLTKSLNVNLKVQMIKTLMWSVLLYGSETWTLRKEDIKGVLNPNF